MEITLEKIELVKDRTGVTYKEAKEALEACDGNVVDAIVFIEEKDNEEAPAQNAEKVASDILSRIKALIKKGNVTKISVTKDDQTIINVPVNAGIIGVAIAPWAMLAAAIATFGFSCKVEVSTDDGKIIDVSSKVQTGIDYAKEKGGKAWNYAKEKAPEAWDYAKEQGEKAWDYAKDKAPEAWDYAKEQGERAWNFTKEQGGKAWDYAKEKAPEAWDYAKEQGERAWDYAKEKAPEAWEFAKEKGGQAWDYAKEKAPEAWDYAKEKGEDVWNYAKEQLDERKVNKSEKLFDGIDVSELDTKIGKEDEK